MTRLAPNITRQRLLVEGYYDINIDKEVIKNYLLDVARHLELRTYGEPMIYSPEGMGKGENQGFDAFIPLIDSGISLYVWTSEKFMSVVFYTCKDFSEDSAIRYTKKFFNMQSDLEHKSF